MTIKVVLRIAPDFPYSCCSRRCFCKDLDPVGPVRPQNGGTEIHGPLQPEETRPGPPVLVPLINPTRGTRSTSTPTNCSAVGSTLRIQFRVCSSKLQSPCFQAITRQTKPQLIVNKKDYSFFFHCPITTVSYFYVSQKFLFLGYDQRCSDNCNCYCDKLLQLKMRGIL